MTGPGSVLALGAGVWLAAMMPAPAATGGAGISGAGSMAGSATSRLGRVVDEFGTITPAMIDQLKAEVWLDVSLVREEGDIPLSLSPRDVVAMRRHYPEIAASAGRKMALIQQLTLGSAPEFMEVGRLFALFYEGVAQNSLSIVLRWRLRRAELAIQALARQTRARRAYVDDFERQMRGTGNSEGVLALPEKSRLDSYLDEAEKRFDKPEQEKGRSHGTTKKDT